MNYMVAQTQIGDEGTLAIQNEVAVDGRTIFETLEEARVALGIAEEILPAPLGMSYSVVLCLPLGYYEITL